MREVKKEKTGWRDAAMSEEHRRWGWDCPANDIDFLMAEYDHFQPIALVEYKNENHPPIKMTEPGLRVVVELGNRALIPVFFVRYAVDLSWWKVHALNDYAKRWPPEATQMTKIEYVEFLYKIRGRPVPTGLFEADKVTTSLFEDSEF